MSEMLSPIFLTKGHSTAGTANDNICKDKIAVQILGKALQALGKIRNKVKGIERNVPVNTTIETHPSTFLPHNGSQSQSSGTQVYKHAFLSCSFTIDFLIFSIPSILY
jgi:hypothetical protein